MPEKVNVAFDPEVDLTDDAVSRSRYERFYSVREKSSSKTFARAQSNGGAFEGTFACEVEATNSSTHFKEYPEVFQNS